MATAVYNNEEINLQDGTTLFLRSMTIKNRRKFMKGFDRLANGGFEGDTPDDAEDELLKLIPYCVLGQRPEWEAVFSEDEEEVTTALEAMMDALDTDTVYYIIKQTAGIDLKAMDQMALEILAKDTSDGTN